MSAARRGLAAAVVAAVVPLCGLSVFASAPASGASAPMIITKTVKRVAKPGLHTIVVTVSSSVSTTATIRVAGQVQTGLATGPGTPAIAEFRQRVSSRRQIAARVSSPAAVTVAVSAGLGTLPPAIGGATGATGATGPTGATGSTLTIGAPPRPPYRKLAWSDSFSGPAGAPPNPANWSYDSNSGCGPGTLSTNTQGPQNAALGGQGQLAISAQRAAGADGQPAYTAAQLDGKSLVSLRYGEIEARIELPAASSGLCSAFWMASDETGAACGLTCGEIDIMEAISENPDVVYATLHGPVQGSANFQQWEEAVSSFAPLAGSWHTYGVIWSPGRISWTIDGLTYATATPASLPASARWVFDGSPFHLILDVAVGGWPGNPAAGASFPKAMRVDWVRVYT
ncbi:MAG TPA: glycoside hydrolase family 16 protein [Solirubrobacteraceae bacterium]|nr:glycoside hydrolase family 16 protein [Solirubrobacteraceae bacterium]